MHSDPFSYVELDFSYKRGNSILSIEIQYQLTQLSSYTDTILFSNITLWYSLN